MVGKKETITELWLVLRQCSNICAEITIFFVHYKSIPFIAAHLV